jgi:hypothetical protein
MKDTEYIPYISDFRAELIELPPPMSVPTDYHIAIYWNFFCNPRYGVERAAFIARDTIQRPLILFRDIIHEVCDILRSEDC